MVIEQGKNESISIRQEKRRRPLTRREFLIVGTAATGILMIKGASYLLKRNGVLENLSPKSSIRPGRAESIISPPTPESLCDFKEFSMDPGLDYTVDDKTIQAILEDSGVDCRELMPLMFIFYRDLIPIKSGRNEGKFALGIAREIESGEGKTRWLSVSASLAEPENSGKRDYSKYNQLIGIKRLEWTLLHELGHEVLKLQGVKIGDEDKEIYCDGFANRYIDYNILREKKSLR
ncbi:MAG TPA: hypothetical protein VMY36_04465 [Patescibacteria group bacterium]|nr:hypothetical protein [Patescibacteria group bacterium]